MPNLPKLLKPKKAVRKTYGFGPPEEGEYYECVNSVGVKLYAKKRQVRLWDSIFAAFTTITVYDVYGKFPFGMTKTEKIGTVSTLKEFEEFI